MKAAKFFGVVLICVGCIVAFVGIAACVLPMIQNDQLRLVLSSFGTASDNVVVNIMNSAMTYALQHCYLVLAAGAGIVLIGALCQIYAARQQAQPQMRWERAGAAAQPCAVPGVVGTVPQWRSSKAEEVGERNPFASIGTMKSRTAEPNDSILPREPLQTFAPSAQSKAETLRDSAAGDEAARYARPTRQEAASPYARPVEEQVRQQAFQPPYQEREAKEQPFLGQNGFAPQRVVVPQGEAGEPSAAETAGQPATAAFRPVDAVQPVLAAHKAMTEDALPAVAAAKPVASPTAASTSAAVSQPAATGIENSGMAALLRKPSAKSGKATVVLSGFKSKAESAAVSGAPVVARPTVAVSYGAAPAGVSSATVSGAPMAAAPSVAAVPAVAAVLYSVSSADVSSATVSGAPAAPVFAPSAIVPDKPTSPGATPARTEATRAPQKPRIKSTIGMHH